MLLLDIMNEMTSYVINEKGEEVISERHQKDYKKEYETEEVVAETATVESFTDISFDDI